MADSDKANSLSEDYLLKDIEEKLKVVDSEPEEKSAEKDAPPPVDEDVTGPSPPADEDVTEPPPTATEEETTENADEVNTSSSQASRAVKLQEQLLLNDFYVFESSSFSYY
ncbi:hypothetical protein L2E82_44101 [Cichorium intybus]|uniref:Uncharacterized protein n=1 Tax=Cichorium intybus TaxID=13427 RepID=A0ACB8ZPU9_CICIN|nr:hypothetical protein L2E82_44101 [Cichorium intybus]